MAKKTKTKLWEWQQKASKGGKCQACKITTLYLTVDHIVPVSFIESLDETGTAIYDDEENFALLCQPCNKLKGNKLYKRNPKTKKIILKYLD